MRDPLSILLSIDSKSFEHSCTKKNKVSISATICCVIMIKSNLGNNLDVIIQMMIGGSFNQVSNEERFSHTNNVSNDFVLVEVIRNNQFSLELK